MKKIIIFTFFLTLLFSKEIILKKEQKEIDTNTTIIQQQKVWLLKHFNSFMPDFLSVSPSESIFKLRIAYDTHLKKTKASLNARLVLPSFERKVSKINIAKNKISTQSFYFKLTPLFLIYKSIPTPVLKTSFQLESDSIVKNSQLAETFYYYFIHNEYKENTTFSIKRIINISNLQFKISKTYLSTDKNNLFYQAGIYYYIQNNKSINTLGFDTNGERKKLPFIYQYRIFLDYRHTIFNKKFTYIEITPYLFASKDYHYKIKPAINISFNTKF